MARGWVRELGKPSPAPVTADREQPVRITVQTGSRTGPEGWRMGSWYQRRPGTAQPGYQGRTPATSRACRGRDRSVNAPVANDTLDTTRELQRKLYRAAKRSPARRFHALYDKVYRRDILERGWEEVRGNRGATGWSRRRRRRCWNRSLRRIFSIARLAFGPAAAPTRRWRRSGWRSTGDAAGWWTPTSPASWIHRHTAPLLIAGSRTAGLVGLGARYA